MFNLERFTEEERVVFEILETQTRTCALELFKCFVESNGSSRLFSHVVFSVLVAFRVQSQVDEVIDVMQENISKVIERGERLDELQDKSGKMDVDGTL